MKFSTWQDFQMIGGPASDLSRVAAAGVDAADAALSVQFPALRDDLDIVVIVVRRGAALGTTEREASAASTLDAAHTSSLIGELHERLRAALEASAGDE